MDCKAIVGRLRLQAHRVFENTRKKDQFSKHQSLATPQMGTTSQEVGLTLEDMSILSGGGGVKEIPNRQNAQNETNCLTSSAAHRCP